MNDTTIQSEALTDWVSPTTGEIFPVPVALIAECDDERREKAKLAEKLVTCYDSLRYLLDAVERGDQFNLTNRMTEARIVLDAVAYMMKYMMKKP